ncbi:MAG: hypothetical protein VX986_04110 [Pseudomonadota bacterium]|nr:hypothetical protein [Pseudomonadota bacterium]
MPATLTENERPACLRKVYRTLTYLVGIGCLIGCSQMGPSFIEGSRTDYNIVMGKTESEQMLLNLVRLRYGDAPYFLEATALNTQFLLTPTAEAGSTFDLDGTATYSIKGKLAYEEKPTVTYSPLRGEDFVRQILSRISLETILLLDSSGWSTERVIRLCVENMNGADNASKASGPTPSYPPDTGIFNEAVNILASLESENGLSIKERVNKDIPSKYVMFLSQAEHHRSRVKKLRKILDIKGSAKEIDLLESGDKNTADSINFQTRSFMGVMYFLAQSVDVPEEHYQTKKIAVTALPDGSIFDWQTVTGSLAKIHSAKAKPPDPAISINYRDTWFYVADDDIRTKSTFQLLGQLFALQSRNQKGTTPLLTLPIGG